MKTARTLVPHSAARLAKRGLVRFAERFGLRFQRLRDYLFAEMDYAPEGWRENGSMSDNWNSQAIADAQAQHWPTLVQNLKGPGPLGVAHFPWSLGREDRTHHNVMMSYGYVLARAARDKQSLSILDWGGGAGHYYLYSRTLLPELDIEYHCFDVRPMCDLGRRLSPEAQFHSDEERLRGRTFDLVISSSSLHYFENWREAAKKLAVASRDCLYIARLQTVFSAPSFVAVHNVNRRGYDAFLSWCLNRDDLVSVVQSAGMELLREFVYANAWAVRGAPERPETRGFLFRRVSAGLAETSVPPQAHGGAST